MWSCKTNTANILHLMNNTSCNWGIDFITINFILLLLLLFQLLFFTENLKI